MKAPIIQNPPQDAIAIIGMDCRFPGAENPAAFWANLLSSTDSLSTFSRDELLHSGVSSDIIDHPDYVPRKGKLQDYDKFDAAFFGYSPLEAKMMDPQHRLFLECCWHALEDAGHTGQGDEKRIGVFAGIGMPTYILNNVIGHEKYNGPDMDYQLLIGNDKDFAPSKVSYKMDLTGPSLNINTACSTSLVTVHMACQSLLDFQCDMILAGAASIRFPQEDGYLYQSGGIPSPDGHCRAFDINAEGVVGGSGVGVVLLKRLEDALVDGDDIYAVIRSSAINNDGANKIGYTAPAVLGEAEVIAQAQALADISADSIGFIEAHGTGTPLGDPIEVEALTKAFRLSTDKTAICALGSVKTNIGHLDTAAGIAGLIKATLAIKHKIIPGTRYFTKPNPKLNLDTSPFYVNSQNEQWESNTPRRAGVSSFGVGGTNAHVILEEAPCLQSDHVSSIDKPLSELLLLSTKTELAMDVTIGNLSQAFGTSTLDSLADTAYTLACGRRTLEHKTFVVADNFEDAVRKLTSHKTQNSGDLASQTNRYSRNICDIAFLIPGQGSQYAGMTKGLYEQFEVYRSTFDLCARHLQSLLKMDIRSLVFDDTERNNQILSQTEFTQPVVFVTSYSLAKFLQSLGITPKSILGHSLGEYVAACLAGVFSLEDGLKVVVARAKLMQNSPSDGGMSVVRLGEQELQAYLTDGLSIAAINDHNCCTISGPIAALSSVEAIFAGIDVSVQRLETSGAFHSELVDCVGDPLRDLFSTIALHEPKIPIVSNLTGEWLTASEATDPNYWAKQMRAPVQFAKGLQLLANGHDTCIEVGAGHTLTSLAKKQGWANKTLHFVPGKFERKECSEQNLLLEMLGLLWTNNHPLQWKALFSQRLYSSDSTRKHFFKRQHLPTYPFQRDRHWIEPPSSSQTAVIPERDERPLEEWFYTPSWNRLAKVSRNTSLDNIQGGKVWLVLIDQPLLSHPLQSYLHERNCKMIEVNSFPQQETDESGGSSDLLKYVVKPNSEADFKQLFSKLEAQSLYPDVVLHAWCLDDKDFPSSKSPRLDLSYTSLIHLTKQLISRETNENILLNVVTATMHAILGDEDISPEFCAIQGPVKVTPLEHPEIITKSIDVQLPRTTAQWKGLAKSILLESQGKPETQSVALRQGHRNDDYYVWQPEFSQVLLSSNGDNAGFKNRGTYLITGGLGGIGLHLAETIARNVNANLVLLSRRDISSITEKISAAAQFQSESALNSLLPHSWLIEQRLHIKNELGIKTIDQHPHLRKNLQVLCSGYLSNYVALLCLESNNLAAIKLNASYNLSSLNIDPKFSKFFDWMISVLCQEHVISFSSGVITWIKEPNSKIENHALLNDLQEQHPDFSSLSNFLQHCVQHYKQAMQGELEAISVLYPTGGAETLAKAVSDTAEHTHHRVYGLLLGRILESIAGKNRDRKIRIMEIGGGNGILTNWIEPILRYDNIEYWFTDLGRSFVVSAEEAYSNYSNMHFACYDANLTPEEQGFTPNSFDIVIELDAVHATADIEHTMSQVRNLLKPNGLLYLLESTRTERWTNMVYGLAAGWWYFTDTIRTDCPLLDVEQWQRVLTDSGYTNAGSLPIDDMPDCALICAQQASSIPTAAYQVVKTEQDLVNKIETIKALGSKVSVLQCDISDIDSLTHAVNTAKSEFSKINGVIHCAATENRGPISLKQPNIQEGEFSAKVHGTRNLIDMLQRETLDFFILSSSISSISPGSGDTEYCSSNACIDAFAQLLQSQGVPALAINWERWRRVGMAHVYEKLITEKTGAGFTGGMDAETGSKAFVSMMNGIHFEQIAMSTIPIQEMISHARKIDIDYIAHIFSQKANSENKRLNVENSSISGNDELVPAASDSEKRIATIWQDVLGIPQIGIHDNFHDIGGDSLIAIKIVSRIKAQFNTDFDIESLFQYPTIMQLAAYLESQDSTSNEAYSLEFDEGSL